METVWKVIALSVGGALGANARYWLGVWVSRWASPGFPWATFLINVTGSLAIGWLVTVLSRGVPHPQARLLLVVGFLGAYTTFSTFAFETVAYWERGAPVAACLNVAGSVGAGVLAVVLGVALGRGWVGATAEAPGASAPAGPESGPP